MASRRATGYVRIIQRKDGPGAYANLKLADGTQPSRRLGKLWTKRTRPPAGYLTLLQAARARASQPRPRGRRHAQEPQGQVRPADRQAARALDELSRSEFFTDAEDRVFVSPTGDVLSQDLLRRRFKRAVKAAGLQDLRLHDLRHTFGTLAVLAFRLSDVKAYMGHAHIETTMLYVHHVPQHDAADRLGTIVASAGSCTQPCTEPPTCTATERNAKHRNAP